MALKTYAEMCSEVAGVLEIGATDFDRMNMANSINRAVKYILSVLPSDLVPECVRSTLIDFEITGCQEVPADFIRPIKCKVIYGSLAAVPCEWIQPTEWPPTNVNHNPTTEHPVFTHVSDFFGITSAGGRGLIAVLPAPTPAKITSGFFLQYLGFGDPVDSSHGIPLNPRLWSPLIHKTCEYVCMVENYDPQRGAIFKAEFNEEIAAILAVPNLK